MISKGFLLLSIIYSLGLKPGTAGFQILGPKKGQRLPESSLYDTP
jgi:hypothetical protein